MFKSILNKLGLYTREQYKENVRNYYDGFEEGYNACMNDYVLDLQKENKKLKNELKKLKSEFIKVIK